VTVNCTNAIWSAGTEPAGNRECTRGPGRLGDRNGDALVFTSARGGGFLTLGQARYAFAKAAAAVDGCVGVRVHDMRHTCASLAIRSGANVKVVQRLLGHKTATLTLDRYGHLYPDDLDAVATAFDTAADDLRTIPTLKAIVSAGSSL
jgi:integrase